MGQGTTMKGIVFDHLRKDNVVQEEWDGQFVIAALESPGVEVSYINVSRPSQTVVMCGSRFPPGVRCQPRSELCQQWRAASRAIAVKFTIRPGEKKTIPMVLCLGPARSPVWVRPEMAETLHRFFWHKRRACVGHRGNRPPRRPDMEPPDRRVAGEICKR